MQARWQELDNRQQLLCVTEYQGGTYVQNAEVN